MPRVVLHIGAFKTGTTFVQSSMFDNRDELAAEGILYPAPGGGSENQVRAVRALLARYRDGGDRQGEDAWDELVEQVRGWPGRLAVVSMEFLSTARPHVVDAAVRSFGSDDVEVILSARDPSKTLPAQWQESIQVGGRTWTYSDYADTVMADSMPRGEMGRHYWGKHNWYQILNRWAAVVGGDRTTLLVAPRTGADPMTLWRRFGEAAGFDAGQYAPSNRRNESLGAESLEVLRRMNVRAAERGTTTARMVKPLLAQQVMAGHRSAEHAVAFPGERQRRAQQVTERFLRKISKELGPRVVGDPAELIPLPVDLTQTQTLAPELLDVAELAAAARYAVRNLAAAQGVKDTDAWPEDLDDQLEEAVSRLVDMVLEPG